MKVMFLKTGKNYFWNQGRFQKIDKTEQVMAETIKNMVTEQCLQLLGTNYIRINFTDIVENIGSRSSQPPEYFGTSKEAYQGQGCPARKVEVRHPLWSTRR
ncbi:MAG: hypothetical protein WA913_06610 [Pricia sp.]